MCMTNVVAALSLSLKTGDGTEGLHLVGCFQLLAEKQDAPLLYRGSLLVAERGRAVKKPRSVFESEGEPLVHS